MISIVIPLLNEEGNLKLLHQKIVDTLTPTKHPYEIIFINDGSTDSSGQILEELFTDNPATIQVINFRQNFGKTAGLTAGFKQCRGDVIVTMDADLQDDPAEIPAMLNKLNEGFDLVAAWRFERQDPVDKTWPSRIFNLAVSKFSGLHLHDFNCGFKMYRRTVTEQIPLYSDFHRFIPVLAAKRGFRVTEIPVQHHPRHSGVSKYGAGRAIRGLMDFVTVLFLTNYLKTPLRLFGSIGLIMFGLGILIEFYLMILWFLTAFGIYISEPVGTRPLFTVGILAMILGIQLFSTGLLGEMLRYFTFKPEQEYAISSILSKD